MRGAERTTILKNGEKEKKTLVFEKWGTDFETNNMTRMAARTGVDDGTLRDGGLAPRKI